MSHKHECNCEMCWGFKRDGVASEPENCDPPGYIFYDNRSMRVMKLVSDGPWKDWIVYKHPDGQWVSLRKATALDWQVLAAAMSASIHAPHSP